MMKYKVLVIDDEPLIRMSLESGLSDLGYQVCCTDTIGEGLSLAARLHPDAVLLDNRVGAERGIDHITDFQKLDEDMILILMTAYGSVSQAVEAMKLGVSHYVQKPFDLDEIDLVITRAMEQLLSRRSLELMKLRPRKLLGESSAICRIRQEIRVLAENDNVDILICGETGTGKEVVVNTIHEQSSRHDKPLVKINCGAIPENLLESELFGHEKGSFTGADKTKKGLIELANGGTVFLDEVGELPLAMQAKLLTFLEDRSFRISRSTSAWQPLPTAIWRQRCRRAASAKISITASTSCRSTFRPCVSGRRTFPYSAVSTSSISTASSTNPYRILRQNSSLCCKATTGRATCASCET